MCMCADLLGNTMRKHEGAILPNSIWKKTQTGHLTTPQHLCCTLVGLINSGFVGISLLHDPVDLAVLCINLIAHIQGHMTEVSNDAAHLLQVFIHFIFSGIICYPLQPVEAYDGCFPETHPPAGQLSAASPPAHCACPRPQPW